MEQHTSESFENLEPADRMKYEIAEELGLLEKVRKGGWKALSSRETGQIGGYVGNRIRSFACIRFGWESDILCPSSVSSSPGIPRNNLPVHRTIHGWCGHRPAHIPQWSDASGPCWSDILHRSED